MAWTKGIYAKALHATAQRSERSLRNADGSKSTRSVTP